MSEPSIFTRIINREIPAAIVYEDDLCMAIKDIHPQAPFHVILFPKKETVSLATLCPADQALAGHLLLAFQKIAAQEGLAEGYRVVSNCGYQAGQRVQHLHFHMLAGREFGWPPG